MSRRLPLGAFGKVTAAAARRETEADAFTVRRLLDDRDRLRLAKRRASYRRDVLSRLKLRLEPILGRPAGEVTRADAARAAEDTDATTSRRVKQYAGTMFPGPCRPWPS